MEAAELVPSADQAHPGKIQNNNETQQNVLHPTEKSPRPLVVGADLADDHVEKDKPKHHVQMKDTSVEIEGLKHYNRSLEYEMSKLQRHNETLNHELHDFRLHNGVLNQMLQGTKIHNEGLFRQVQDLEARLYQNVPRTVIRSYQNELHAATQSNEYVRKIAQEVSENLEGFKKLQEDVRTANNRNTDVQRKLDETRNELTAAENLSEALKSSINRLQEQLAMTKQELWKTKEATGKTNTAQRTEISRLERLLQDKEAKIQKFKLSHTTAQQPTAEISRLERLLQDKEAEIQTQHSTVEIMREKYHVDEAKLESFEHSASFYKNKDAENTKTISTLKRRVELLEEGEKQHKSMITQVEAEAKEKEKAVMEKLERYMESVNQETSRLQGEILGKSHAMLKAIGRDRLLFSKYIVDTVYGRLGDVENTRAANCVVDEINAFLNSVDPAIASLLDRAQEDRIQINKLTTGIQELVPHRANDRDEQDKQRMADETASFMKEINIRRHHLKSRIRGKPNKDGSSPLGFLKPDEYLIGGYMASSSPALRHPGLLLASIIVGSLCLRILDSLLWIEGWWASIFRACTCVCGFCLVMPSSVRGMRRQ